MKLKRLMAAVLAIMLVVVGTFATPLTTQEASALSFETKTSGVTFTENDKNTHYIKYIPTNFSSTCSRVIVYFGVTDSSNLPKLTQISENGEAKGDTKGLTNRTYEFELDKKDGTAIYFKLEPSAFGNSITGKFTITDTPYPYNQSEASATALKDNTNIVDFNTLTTVKTSYAVGSLFYCITATEKAYYKVDDGGASCRVNNTSADYVGSDPYVYNESYNEYLVNAGDKLYIKVNGKADKDYKVTVSRDLFNRMTDMSFDTELVRLTKEQSKDVTLNFTKLANSRKLETTIKSISAYSMPSKGEYQYSNSVEVEQLTSKTSDTSYTYNFYAKEMGKYVVKATNSEGMVAETIVEVVPDPVNVQGAYSTGTTNLSVVHWGEYGYATGYYIYKDGEYVATNKGSAANEYIFKDLGANKTYVAQIAALYQGNFNGEPYTLVGEKSDDVVFITAGTAKPTLKSATATKTKYTKAKKVWHSGHYDGIGIWHEGYYQTIPASSAAYVKVKFTAAKGSTRTESNTTAANKTVKNGGTTYYTFSGKTKAGKKQTVKVRGVWTKGSSTAYGPWSKAKTVKLKAAK